MAPFAAERDEMVLVQLERRGVKDPRVLDAMRSVPRHLFVPIEQRHVAYRDGPLSIGHCQTISQPYIVALMAELLQLKEDGICLDVGTGSGYAAAVLAKLCAHVSSVERLPELVGTARNNLIAAGSRNIDIVCGDGSLGYPEGAPYDAIAVAAGAPFVPEPLKEQLKPGGRLVVPVGPSRRLQELIVVHRISDGAYETENLGGVAFVPFVGAHAWPEN
ncbi:protein-L-isoaspartate(D-aspartate) O-methyltransferase [uncultured Roseibium sp.]|uniref:protein-L-isoaspartate(D-aspartate) O-methyltransferase n=1 Tax=uncultured Roseibium sp. TaxID=1936171 RepID=UPI00263955E3|nr:protein-L-isoaspartate(D-aspartate) O-methyltransferase [uncultured Roseibium sp.]